MISNLLYWIELGFKDTVRSRLVLFATASIFAGICAMVLLLAGMKNGLVARLYENMNRNSTAVEGTWAAQRPEDALNMERAEKLTSKLPKGTLICPRIEKVVGILRGGVNAEGVTLTATVPNDPALRLYGCELTDSRAPEIVVSAAVAEELGVKPEDLNGKTVTVTVCLTRRGEVVATVGKLEVELKGILMHEGIGAKRFAYMNQRFVDAFEDFVQGEPVAEFGWPGETVRQGFGHSGFLAFSKEPYSDEDLKKLHLRGFRADLIDQGKIRDLYGLMKPHALHAYMIAIGAEADEEVFSNFKVSEIEEITIADDVMLCWNQPIPALVGGEEHLLVGVSGSLRWMRGFLLDPDARLQVDDLSSVILTSTAGQPVQADLGDVVLNLKPQPSSEQLKPALWTRSSDSDPNSARPLALVSAGLLAAIHNLRAGDLTFDTTLQQFQRVRRANYYYSGRFIAPSLDDVLKIDQVLKELGYGATSSVLRVIEIQSYSRTLDLLVRILQAVAVLLGIGTSACVFFELTNRKQRVIGVMRVIGLDALGVFIFILVRALIIATLGWVIAVAVTVCFKMLLPWFADAEVRLELFDYLTVLATAIVCAAIGISWHAFTASRIAPTSAIRNGELQ